MSLWKTSRSQANVKRRSSMTVTEPSTRRQVLKRVARTLPALVAGAALSQIGLAGAKGRGSKSQFPGDPGKWRDKFLREARAARALSPPADAVATPIRLTDTPLVMDVSRGGLPGAAAAT